jgi:hypothetical protein
MLKHRVNFIIILLAAISCSPKVTTRINKNYPPLNYKEEVRVYGLSDPVPASEELGVVKIVDNGFSANCGYDVVIEKAKLEARKIGGNAIKITDHRTPSTFGSSCHQIAGKILKIENLETAANVGDEKTLGDVDYAMLHVYRFGGMGAAVGYDLYLGDSVICRVKNNRKQSIKIYKDGRNMVWAKTESKSEVPVNIQFGKEYFIRCGIKMGAFVGRPTLQITDYSTGKAEFESIKSKK